MNSQLNKPILYSFRRCPYAIRARICLAYTQIEFELRNILLKNKPQELLAASAKGTVPVLVLKDVILDESMDIIKWCLSKNDPDDWRQKQAYPSISTLIAENDGPFKALLDEYKYADGNKSLEAREKAYTILASWEQRLSHNSFLVSDQISVADIALFPFVRQFAKIDWQWFEAANLPQLQKWLIFFLESELFKKVMQKQPLWSA